MSVGVLFTQGLVTGGPHTVLGEVLEQAEAADRLGDGWITNALMSLDTMSAMAAMELFGTEVLPALDVATVPA
jgi:hypothetical protein